MSNKKILVIGSGPAGYTSAIYASRAGFETTIVQGVQPGGQLTITSDIENYPGYEDPISGPWLMEQMEKQTKNVGAKVVFDTISEVDFSKRPFICKGDSEEYVADAVIVATGAQAKWLGVKGEQEYSGSGVSACATCDGFFFRNKEVIVIGGGNTAVEEAIYLSGLASKVILLHRRDSLRAEKILQKRLFENKKIEVIWDSVLDEVIAKDNIKVTSVKVTNIKSNKVSEIPIDGVFIAIGHKPSTDIFKNKLDMDEEGYIKVKPGTTITSVEGVFAVGDVQDKVYRQAITAAGLGCMGALDAEKFLYSE